jgi:hypothetical protein
MSKTFSPKNLPELVLPLMNLKGNDYMKVAHRLLWFVNDVKSYSIESDFLERTEQAATAKVTVQIYNEEGRVVRRAQSTKRETKSDFNDFTEKAETGALGRCLASLGYGTAQAISDLEENTRIVDAPLETPAPFVPEVNGKAAVGPATTAPVVVPAAAKPSSFAKKKGASASASNVVTLPTAPAPAPAKAADGWD